MSPRPKSIEKRLWEKIEKRGPDECWYWMAHTSHGYGQLLVRLEGDRRSKNKKYAHRLVYEMTYGPIPDGMWVLHRCDTPLCCNPSHLFLGNHQDNIQDRDRKERQARGTKNGKAKLTDTQVEEIKLLLSQCIDGSTIARRYGVSRYTIADIKHGRSWCWIAPPHIKGETS